jgi:hypothetical protein
MTRKPMTANERQELERARNRRAREAVLGLKDFSTNALDWEKQQELSRQDILSAIYNLARWAIEGQAFIDDARLISPPGQRALTATMFDRFNIDLPFCRSCGSDLKRNPEGGWQRCRCKRTKAA